MSIVAIFNPRSGRGKTAQTWAKARGHLRGTIEVFETKAPGHGTELAAKAIRNGARTVIAVGGDGTINEVLNGFFENDAVIAPEATLGIIPHGTGSDLVRLLKIPLEPEKAAAAIQGGEARLVDVFKARYTRTDGAAESRYGINVASFGMGGAVAARANRSSKPFGGRIAFIAATLRTASAFRGNDVTLQLDASKIIQARIMNVAVGNGQYHGAGMWVCPGASMEDGLLDVTVVRHLSLLTLVRSLPLLYNGEIYSHPKVERHDAKVLKADSAEPVLIEIDGEPVGRLPLEVSILPRTLRILLP